MIDKTFLGATTGSSGGSICTHGVDDALLLTGLQVRTDGETQHLLSHPPRDGKCVRREPKLPVCIRHVRRYWIVNERLHAGIAECALKLVAMFRLHDVKVPDRISRLVDHR